MIKFFKILLSDSNKISTKRFIGLLCLAMFLAYGAVALFKPFVLEFWIFYVSLCVITIWIAFKFMSSEKLLKYDVITKLTSFGKAGKVTEAVTEFVKHEENVDDAVRPEEKDPDDLS